MLVVVDLPLAKGFRGQLICQVSRRVGIEICTAQQRGNFHRGKASVWLAYPSFSAGGDHVLPVRNTAGDNRDTRENKNVPVESWLWR